MTCEFSQEVFFKVEFLSSLKNEPSDHSMHSSMTSAIETTVKQENDEPPVIQQSKKSLCTQTSWRLVKENTAFEIIYV